MSTTTKKIIGRSVKISFPDSDIKNLPAKVDTGAYSSSIWASNIREKNGVLYFTLLDPTSTYFSGKRLSSKDYKIVNIENSFGQSEDRFAVRLRVNLEGDDIQAMFTLANRHVKSYPALIGRSLLRDRYIVDVTHGSKRIKNTNGVK